MIKCMSEMNRPGKREFRRKSYVYSGDDNDASAKIVVPEM